MEIDYEKEYTEALGRAKRLRDLKYQTMNAKRVAEEIFPVLAESEDERIRKNCIHFLKLQKTHHADTSEIDDCIAYLEKQKEQKPELYYDKELDIAAREFYLSGGADSPVDSTGLVPIVRMAEFGATWMKERTQKEQKAIPLMNGDADLYFDNWIQHNDTTKRGCFEEGIRYAQRLQKEQKAILSDRDSTDFEIEVHEIIAQARNDSRLNDADVLKQFEEEAAFALMLKANKLIEQKPAGCADDVVEEAEEYASKVACGEYGVEVTEAYIAGVLSERNRGTEWSEFDKGVLKDAICATDTLGNDESFNKSNPNLAKAFRVAKEWLKSLPERLNLQPKQEWGEEDEANLDYLIDYCNSQENGQHPILVTSIARKISLWLYRLKSGEITIKRQANEGWSNDDEEHFDSVCSVLRSKLDEGNWKPLIDLLLRLKTAYCYQRACNEKDEKTIHLACEFIRHHATKIDSIGGIDCSELVERLKSLRPQKLDASKLENFDPVDVLHRIKKEWPMAWEKAVGKQEWSEEDERMRNELITIMNGGKVTSGTYLSEYAAWLKSLPDRFNLQPKQEWTEEDKRNIDRAVFYVRYYQRTNGNTDGSKECIDWLKSLRPQPKVELTLLDENIIEAAVAFVEQNNHFNCWRGIDKHTVIKALRSLKPHWKPSEEQMRFLLAVINDPNNAGSESCHLVLKELYEQLKTL